MSTDEQIAQIERQLLTLKMILNYNEQMLKLMHRPMSFRVCVDNLCTYLSTQDVDGVRVFDTEGEALDALRQYKLDILED
jgi:hypothetical protein